MPPLYAGFDLGTSNSVVAVIDRDGAPRILTTEEGSTTLPSLVWFSPAGPIVGERAREGLDGSPDLTIFGAKRLLGRRFDHPEVRRLARASIRAGGRSVRIRRAVRVRSTRVRRSMLGPALDTECHR